MSKFVQIYSKAIQLAHSHSQTVGEKNDYYVTLEQLNEILMDIEEPDEA